jgi:hypothetical protein
MDEGFLKYWDDGTLDDICFFFFFKWGVNTLGQLALQDLTVLPTKIFRRYVIKISSVIYLPTSSPTEYDRQLFFHR